MESNRIFKYSLPTQIAETQLLSCASHNYSNDHHTKFIVLNYPINFHFIIFNLLLSALKIDD